MRVWVTAPSFSILILFMLLNQAVVQAADKDYKGSFDSNLGEIEKSITDLKNFKSAIESMVDQLDSVSSFKEANKARVGTNTMYKELLELKSSIKSVLTELEQPSSLKESAEKAANGK